MVVDFGWKSGHNSYVMFDSRPLRLALSFIAGCLSFAPFAQAEQFVWSDKNQEFTINVPDDWARTSARFSDEVIAFQAPGQENFASCRVRVREDHRYDIYPPKYDAAIAQKVVGDQFWADYMGIYSGYRLNRFTPYAGLGEATASKVDVTFIDENGYKVLKRGMALAGLHQGQVYVFECASDYQVYHRFAPIFSNILASFQHRWRDLTHVGGDYRPFLNDRTWVIHHKDPVRDYRF